MFNLINSISSYLPKASTVSRITNAVAITSIALIAISNIPITNASDNSDVCPVVDQDVRAFCSMASRAASSEEIFEECMETYSSKNFLSPPFFPTIILLVGLVVAVKAILNKCCPND